MSNYYKKSPCNNCPYRVDAPLQLWHREEFEKLAAEETNNFGAIYQCHKKDRHVCVGWLMKQDEHNFPNINLRLSLSKNNITRKYLDALHCNVELYESVADMIKANYPKIKLK